MVTTITAARLVGPYQEKPTHAVVPRQYWRDRGLRFLSLMDRPQPQDLMTGQLPSVIPTQNSNGGMIRTPWGYGCHVTHGNGPLQYPDHDFYDITGPLTILMRAWIDAEGSDSYWNGIVKKRANGSSTQANCPFAVGCSNYYNGGDRTIKFGLTRANAGGYRSFNGPSEEHIGTDANSAPIYKNFAITSPAAIETAGHCVIDGVIGTMGGQGTAGSGTGAATGNSDILHFGDDGTGVATKEVFDWVAIFAAQLTVPEIHEIMAAPFGELVEPEIGRDIHDLWPSYTIAAQSSPKVGGMRGGFYTGLDAGFR